MEETKPKKQKKPKKPIKIGFFTILLMLVIVILAIMFTPLAQFIFSLIPETTYRHILKNTVQQITLAEPTEQITKPKKYSHTQTLPVLGTQSGLCFEFNADALTKKQRTDIENRKALAEVIAQNIYLSLIHI